MGFTHGCQLQLKLYKILGPRAYAGYLCGAGKSEGAYSAIGGIQYQGTANEVVVQQSLFTRRGTDRIFKYAFELAQAQAAKHLTSATKSNGIVHSMPYWDARVAQMAKKYPDMTVDQYHIDILTANFVRMPEHFDVVVASNLFGDILSDLGPACTGAIGLAPSANINPEKRFASMFEPVHGSTPDIAGQDVANPSGAIWARAMMVKHLGFNALHDHLLNAIETVLAQGRHMTPDMGGTATTKELSEAILAVI